MQSLIKLLKSIDSLISTDCIECGDENAFERFENIKKLLITADVNIKEAEDIYLQCTCHEKRVYCLVSCIALSCANYLKKLCSSSNLSGDMTYTLQDKQFLLHIIEFVICFGLVKNVDFSISVLVPVQDFSHCSKRTLLSSCKCILLCLEDETFHGFLLPKHLLPILGALMQLVYCSKSLKTLVPEDASLCKRSLLRLISEWSQTKDLVKCLLILQGSSTRITPTWLRKACGFLLSKCLLRQHGVAAVLSTCLSILGNDLSAWKRAEIASQVLSTPSKTTTEENYFSNICFQLLDLFRSQFENNKENDDDKLFLQALCSTVLTLYGKSPKLTDQCFFMNLMRPFNQFYNIIIDGKSKNQSLNLRIITSIETLHAIFVLFKHPQVEIVVENVLLPRLQSIFALYMWSKNTPLHLQTLLRQLLVKSLQIFEPDKAAYILLSLCNVTTETKSTNQILPIRDCLRLASDEDGEVVVTDVSTRNPEDIIDDQNSKVQATLDLIAASGIDKLPAKVFISLLKIIEKLSKYEGKHESNNALLTNDEKAALHLQSGESQLLAYALLTSLCEDANSEKLFEDIPEIVSFLTVFLERSLDLTSTDDEHFQISNESLRLCFAVLGMCLVNPLSSEQKKFVVRLVPLLQRVSQAEHLLKEDREMASDLAIAVAAHGCGSDIAFDSFSKSMQEQLKDLDKKINKHKEFPIKTCAEKSGSSATPSDVNKPHSDNLSAPKLSASRAKLINQTYTTSKASESQLSSFNEALSSIYDPCPSVRAAALRFITSATKKRSKEVNENSSKLLQIFVEVLMREEDSFVYLSAIQALVEIIDSNPITGNVANVSFFDKLINEYERNMSLLTDDSDVKIIKLGEILVRLIGKLGDVSEHQGKKLLPVLLRGSRDRRAAVRSSCVSNLAELCPFMKHQLSAYQYELSECVCATATSDDDVNTRRAAIFVIRKLIEGLESEFLKIFSDSIKRFYSVLKRCYQNDSDHVIQLHAQLALEALDSLMRDVLFVKPTTLQKKITVLP